MSERPVDRDQAAAPSTHAEAVAEVDELGRIVALNGPAASIVSVDPEAVVGSGIVHYIHPDDRALAARLLDEALADGRSGPVELRILVPEGGWVWLRCVTTREQTDPPRVRIAIADASEARRLAEQLERTTNDLQREHAELVRRSGAMADLAGLLTGVDNLDYLIRGLSGVALRHLAPLVAIMLIEDDAVRVVHLAHANHRAEALLRKSIAHLERGEFTVEGMVGRAIIDGSPQVNFEDPFHPDLPDLLPEFLSEFGIGARAVFPLRIRQQSIGALLLAKGPESRRFSAADIDLARMLAGRAALALDTARTDGLRRTAEELSVQRATQQSAIAELGSAALSGTSLEDLAQRCRVLVRGALGVTHCGVLMTDSDTGIQIVASSARTPEAIDARLISGEALMVALKRDGSVTVSDYDDHDMYGLDPRLRHDGIRSMAVAQIDSVGGAAGLLAAGSADPDRFGPDDIVFLAAMANVLASAADARQAMDELHRIASRDALTGLPNRDVVLKSLDDALANTAPGRRVAVLVCDVDRFKVVNDALGHAAGDDVLRAFAERLTGHLRPGDMVGRFGGDEFVVVCPSVSDLDAVTAIAARLAATFATPLSVMGTRVVTTASIGIALSEGPGDDVAVELLRNADAAMYRAKENGRARFEVFDDGMRELANRRLRTETDLRAALVKGELVLHYQPIVSVDDGHVIGVEALARWEHPELGLLPPGDFIGVAFECGLAADLASWALDTAARQVAEWSANGIGFPWIAINLAAQQLADPALLERVDTVLERSGAASASLRLEITEDALVDDAVLASEVLDALRARGLGISIDDFGTGYSSLAYLKQLPADCLKLDGSFVRNLIDDDDDKVIAAAVIGMAGALGLDVVAECVETQDQLQVLRAMGCRKVQGFYLSRPLPAAELELWLKARTNGSLAAPALGVQ